VARSWLSSSKGKDDKGGKKGKEKTKGGKDWVAPDEEEKKAAKNIRPSHMTYLVAEGGAQVQYVNCYCDNDGDHSRGTYP
jgi:hypothetical protein